MYNVLYLFIFLTKSVRQNLNWRMSKVYKYNILCTIRVLYDLYEKDKYNFVLE